MLYPNSEKDYKVNDGDNTVLKYCIDGVIRERYASALYLMKKYEMTIGDGYDYLNYLCAKSE